VTGCANGTLVQVPELLRTIPGGACFAACKCDYDLNGVPWWGCQSRISSLPTA
jgi:hypothetical protein